LLFLLRRTLRQLDVVMSPMLSLGILLGNMPRCVSRVYSMSKQAYSS
jgi:hypothetical protein